MTYLVNINPRPGEDNRIVEVEGDCLNVKDGALCVGRASDDTVISIFAPGIWNYVELKK